MTKLDLVLIAKAVHTAEARARAAHKSVHGHITDAELAMVDAVHRAVGELLDDTAGELTHEDYQIELRNVSFSN